MKRFLAILWMLLAASALAATFPTNTITLAVVTDTNGTLVGRSTNLFFGHLTNTDGTISFARLPGGRLDVTSTGGTGSGITGAEATNIVTLILSNSPTLDNPTMIRFSIPADTKTKWGEDGWIWYENTSDSFYFSNSFHQRIIRLDDLESPNSIATRSIVTNIVQAIGGGSSTVTNLDDVGDVALGSPANGDVLKYDSASSRWTNSPDLVGAEGSGLASLNGLTNSSQSFAIGESGTVPAWVSAGGTHTLNLPYASNNVHGIIASNDWATFLAKASTTQLNAVSLANSNLSYAIGTAATNFTLTASNNVRLVAGLAATNHANAILQAATNYADSVGGSGGLAAINGIGSNITLRAAALSGPPLTLIGNADGSSDTFSVLSPSLANLFSVESDGGIIAAKNAAFQGNVTVTSNLTVGGTATYGTLSADTLESGEITATNLTASRILATDSSNVVVSLDAPASVGQSIFSTSTGYAWSNAPSGSGTIDTNAAIAFASDVGVDGTLSVAGGITLPAGGTNTLGETIFTNGLTLGTRVTSWAQVAAMGSASNAVAAVWTNGVAAVEAGATNLNFLGSAVVVSNVDGRADIIITGVTATAETNNVPVIALTNLNIQAGGRISLPADGTNTLGETIFTNGVTIGGTRYTSWPSGTAWGTNAPIYWDMVTITNTDRVDLLLSADADSSSQIYFRSGDVNRYHMGSSPDAWGFDFWEGSNKIWSADTDFQVHTNADFRKDVSIKGTLSVGGQVITNAPTILSATATKSARFDASRQLVSGTYDETDFALAGSTNSFAKLSATNSAGTAVFGAVNTTNLSATNIYAASVTASSFSGPATGQGTLSIKLITSETNLGNYFAASNDLTVAGIGVASALNHRVNVKDFGALGTGLAHTNVTIALGSTNLSGTNSTFSAGDEGKLICIEGCGPGGATNDLLARISHVYSATSVGLDRAAIRAASEKNCVYGWDDSTNIQNALNYAVTNRLTLYFPPGIYVVNGYFQNTTTKNAIFTVPNRGESMPSGYGGALDYAYPIRIEGESLATTGGGVKWFGWQGSCIAMVNNTNATGNLFNFGDDSAASTTGGWSDSGDIGTQGYNNSVLRVKGITVRAPNNCQQTIFDGTHLSGCSYEDVNVFAGHNSYAAVIQPTKDTSFAIRMSATGLNGNGINTLDRVQVAGTYSGIEAWEHTHLRTVTVFSSIIGVYFKQCYHLASSDRLGFQSVMYPMRFEGDYNRVMLNGVDIEHNGTTYWYSTSADIVDSGNTATGFISYTIAPTGGAGNTLIKTGGKGIKGYDLELFPDPNFLAPTNGVAEGTVLTFAGGTNRYAAASGAQTPWTADINGGGYSLTNVGRITATNGMFVTGPLYPVASMSNGDIQFWNSNACLYTIHKSTAGVVSTNRVGGP